MNLSFIFIKCVLFLQAINEGDEEDEEEDENEGGHRRSKKKSRKKKHRDEENSSHSSRKKPKLDVPSNVKHAMRCVIEMVMKFTE